MIKLTKHGDYEIWMDSSDSSGDEFYKRMGKYFADRQIRKELEEPLSDGPGFRWLIAYKKNEIAGFACLNAENLEKRGEAWLTYAYIFEPHRKNGLHSILFDERIVIAKQMKVKVLRGVANEKSYDVFVKNGFEIQSERGRFTYFKKEMIYAENE
jgi:hypothetical protein